MIYEKANSVVEQYLDVPSWIHRHLIGKKGADILKTKEDSPKIYFEKNKDRQEKDNRIRKKELYEKTASNAEIIQAIKNWLRTAPQRANSKM
ncbi:uncharacterized protein LOC120355589 isoform X2 [Nilaparvata lugens]|nr:uncharacterized protein LOC120355589 isoform X2 [Nilaparvata lugens]